MDGEKILRDVITERLRELDSVPEDMRSVAAGRIVSFCLGASDALMKARLLPQGHPEALDHLYAEIERRGLGQRVSASMEAHESVVSWREESNDPPS